MQYPGTNRCPICHAPLDMKSEFCGNCGTYLGSSSYDTVPSETKPVETLQHVSPPSVSNPPMILPGLSQNGPSNQQVVLPGTQEVEKVVHRKKQVVVLGALIVSVALVLLVIGGLALADVGKRNSTPVAPPQSTSTPGSIPSQHVTPSPTSVSEPTPTQATTPTPIPTPSPKPMPIPTSSP